MMTERPAATAATAAIPPILLSPLMRRRIFLYLGVLIILLAFGSPSGGLIDIPITFFLKNKLHLKSHELAHFRLVSAIPLYLSFVFGFIRDSWNPFGMRDRGFMLLFGAVTAGLYVLFAFIPITYGTLLAATVLLTTSFLFVASAQNGLTSTLGQQHAMSGQISAVWNIFLARLARHWPIYPALLIWLLWNFAPGSATPLQYYLQNALHAQDTQWGQWNAIYAASFIPTFMVFGLLCRRLPLRTLLLWGTVAAVPQFVPLLFIKSMTAALIAAVPVGLMGGVATASYLDLIIRSCPSGLQGTTLMMSSSIFFIVSRSGDVLGTSLYDDYGGFAACVAAITVVYAMILPALLLVPKHLTATADGEPLEPRVAAEQKCETRRN